MTPFGVGYFSADKDSTAYKRRPVYIDGWAQESVWQQDITDLYPLIAEIEAYIGIYIDTWTDKGYKVNLEINFIGKHYKTGCDVCAESIASD